MIADLLKAFAQLSDRRFRRVVLLSCLLAALLLAALAAAPAGRSAGLPAWAGSISRPASPAGLPPLQPPPCCSRPRRRRCRGSSWSAPPGRSRPGTTRIRDRPTRRAGGETLRQTLFFVGAALGLNLLLLPVWLILPPVGLVLFWLLNGWLCGREYFEAAALRRLDPEAVRALRRRYRMRLWFAGVAIAWMMTLPLANLAAPALGTAFMLHRFERLRRL